MALIIIGCTEPKAKNNINDSSANTQKQIQSEEGIKKERMMKAEIGKVSPIGKILDSDSSQISTNDFKGKLLIIDFWATWCSPCLEEAPKFKDLERKYENERVEFVTISIDDEFSYWKEFIAERDWETNNYWFGMDESEPFFAYMYSKVELEDESKVLISLPKYVIISPSGKILNNQAPKPSDPEFEIELLTLIKEHAS